MQAASYFLPRPPLDLTPEKQSAFDGLWRSCGAGSCVNYSLPYPRWEFLSYLCETKVLVLHGSQHHGIAMIEPRQARDVRAFSNQRAIYATTDGIWAIFFAIVDRLAFPQMSLFNSCLSVRDSSGTLSDPLYFFSVSQPSLLQKPWCKGTVYILPRQAFQQEAAQRIEGMEIVFPHWISAEAAWPVGCLVVGPQDFPFLAQVHGHNDQKLIELHASNPGAVPWQALES